MNFYTWSLSLTLTAPFLTGGGENLTSKYDSILYRDEHGRIAFSGAHISGHFRHFLEAVHKAEEAEDIAPGDKLVSNDLRRKWFGVSGVQMRDSEADEHIAWASPRGFLTFRDIPIKEDSPSHARTRIAVGHQSASATPGAWQVLEQTHKTGETVEFQEQSGRAATLELYATKRERKIFEAAFKQFRKALVAIGANKGQGFGRIHASGIDLLCRKKVKLEIPGKKSISGTSFDISFDISHPLLVEPTQYSGNLFRSSSAISGATIKAALAEMGDRVLPGQFQATFGDSLSEMSIGHFQPVAPGTIAPPLVAGFDIVAAGSYSGLCNIADIDNGSEIIFAEDMKQETKDKFEDIYKHHQPKWLNRTRTAITLDTFTAKDHQLFNYQCVSSVGTKWRGRVELPNEDDIAIRLLDFLQDGFIQIGRLRSRIVNMEITAAEKPPIEKDGDCWRIVLQTPAHLLGVDAISDIEKTGLRDLYFNLFETQLGKGSIDKDSFQFFARHAWYGGAKASRFMHKIDGKIKYYPYLLTQPGSVFIFKPEKDIEEKDIGMKLKHLARFGLQSADFASGWKKTPFLRECGFGAVSILPHKFP